MSEEWRDITLGDVLTRVKRPVSVLDGVEYPAVSVLKDGQGLGVKEPFQGGVTNYSTLFQVRQGDVVVRTITAFESPVAVAEPQHDATHVSQVFLTYEVNKCALPAFLALHFQTPAFWEEMRNRAQGTVLRRKTISDSAFRSIPLNLPPLPVQRRIVDLMEHLDNQVNALNDSVRAASETLKRFLDTWVVAHPPGTVSVGEHCRFRSGPSWAAADESTTPGDDRTPVVKITNTRPDGTLDLHELVYVRGLPDSGHRLGENSLIVIRTNGNRARIGNVYLSPLECTGFAVSAFQFAGTASSADSRDFLYWFLRAPVTQQAMSEAASGTTGLGNLAVRWLNGLPVPAASDAEVAEFVATAGSLGDLTEALTQEHQALTDVRGSLLQTLLTGSTTLPHSYDELLGVAS
jgi:restriction endonuclease S subunit